METITPLKRARRRLGVTQKALAAAVEVDVSHLGRVERGLVGAGRALAAKLSEFFLARHVRLTEMQILYPRRYANSSTKEAR